MEGPKEKERGEKNVESRIEKGSRNSVYVIIGDRMLVGVVSCLDWQAG